MQDLKVLSEGDFVVDWKTMSAQQISQLARASNAQFGGCRVSLANTELGLFQATPVSHSTFGVPAGTVCHVGEPEGVIVATHDGAIRIDVLSNADGIFSGINFFDRFGIDAGMGV